MEVWKGILDDRAAKEMRWNGHRGLRQTPQGQHEDRIVWHADLRMEEIDDTLRSASPTRPRITSSANRWEERRNRPRTLALGAKNLMFWTEGMTSDPSRS